MAIGEQIPTGTDAALGTYITRQQLRGSSILLVGHGLALALNFLPHVLLVRYLATVDYGIWAYALTVVTVCQTFALSLNESMMRFASIHYEKRERGELMGTVLLVCGVTALVGVGCIVAWYAAPGQLFEFLTKGRDPIWPLGILIFLVPLETISVLLMNLFACFARPTAILVGRYVLDPSLKCAVVLVTIYMRKGLVSLAYGRVLVAVTIVLVYGSLMFMQMRREGLLKGLQLDLIRIRARDIFVFAIPQFTSNVLGALEGAMVVVLLGYFHDISEVAMYRVVLPLAALNDVVMTAFAILYTAAAARLYANGNIRGINFLYWQTAAWIGVLSFPIFVVTFCFARPVTVLLYGERYVSSGITLALISLGHYFNSTLGFNGITLRVLGRIRYVVTVNLAASALLVLLTLALVPRFGAVGAAVACSTTIIAHTALKQIGLGTTPGFNVFEARYLGFYGLIAFSTFAILAMRLLADTSLIVQIVTSSIAGIAVVVATRHQLEIVATFPEIRRLPIIGKFLA